jgi:hypothetical protein
MLVFLYLVGYVGEFFCPGVRKTLTERRAAYFTFVGGVFCTLMTLKIEYMSCGLVLK